jgi:hypothetical protein
MKKLATIVAAVASLAIAAPVFACPDMDHSESPRTAEKAKDSKDAKGQDKAKAEPKKDTKANDKTAKPANDTKPADKTEKKGDKVSIK